MARNGSLDRSDYKNLDAIMTYDGLSEDYCPLRIVALRCRSWSLCCSSGDPSECVLRIGVFLQAGHTAVFILSLFGYTTT